MSTLTLQHPRFLPMPSTPRPASAPKLRLSSDELFRNGSELVIEHRGEEYRLKLTRNDKLILNK